MRAVSCSGFSRVLKTTSPSVSEFCRKANDYDIVPLVRAIAFDSLPVIDPVRAYKALRTDGPGFILESGKGGRRSYVGLGSGRVLEIRGEYNSLFNEGEEQRSEGYPFEFMRQEFSRRTMCPHPLLPDFSGGGVGYLSYDMARRIERLPSLAQNDLELPDARFIFPEEFLVFDHEDSCLLLVTLLHPNRSSSQAEELWEEGQARLDRLQECLSSASFPPVDFNPDPYSEFDLFDVPEGNLRPEEFQGIVRRAIDYILAGDIFQVNLSVRFSRRYDNDPLTLYEVLRRINPAPYMTFLEFPDHAIVGASPELLVKVSGKKLATRPIAGTRRRGENEREDDEKVRELIENEKERAEHLMLVDLERNDLGRVARYGSVHVDEFMAIEKYSHVIHIVSNVRAELAEGKDLFDAIQGVFPGGTITGAPKVRAMEIIEELEPQRRGIYTGSIGWIGFNGDAELNIAIRTMLIKDGYAHAQAGAGIVADSVPEYEYKESVRKAEAALRALQQTVESL